VRASATHRAQYFASVMGEAGALVPNEGPRLALRAIYAGWAMCQTPPTPSPFVAPGCGSAEYT
jgi:hypothetical protein